MKNVLTDHPRKFDFGIMLTLVTMLFGAMMYIMGNSVMEHDFDSHAHPQLFAEVQQNSERLVKIESTQLMQAAMAMDARVCQDPQNRAYREELARLIAEWEALTERRFPRELLACVR